MSWVAVSPVILIDAGGMTTSEFAWAQAPVFGAVIVANMVVVRFVKDPTRPLLHLAGRTYTAERGWQWLIVGNLLWPHVGCGRCWEPACMRLVLG